MTARGDRRLAGLSPGYSRSCDGDEPGCSAGELEPVARNRSLSCFVAGSRASAFSPVVRAPVIRQPPTFDHAQALTEHCHLLPLGPDVSRYFERFSPFQQSNS